MDLHLLHQYKVSVELATHPISYKIQPTYRHETITEAKKNLSICKYACVCYIKIEWRRQSARRNPMQIEVSTVDEVKWALMNKFMKLECSYVLKVAAVCNLWSLISSAQQIDKSYLMEGSQIPYVREHRPTAALHVLYIKSHLPPECIRAITHTRISCVRWLCVTLHSQHYSDSQLHLCWKAVCRQAFLFDSCSEKTAVLSVAFYYQHALFSTCSNTWRT